jgi:hypothetical protein
MQGAKGMWGTRVVVSVPILYIHVTVIMLGKTHV